MGSTVADYDGDGKLDIFKTNFSDDTSTLYRNNGNGTFDDVTFAAGLGLYTRYLGWGTMFLDFDNDGWPDLLLVNGHVYPEVDKQNLGSSYEEPRILLSQQRQQDVQRHLGPGRVRNHGGSCRARVGGRRSVERRANFSRDQQHECEPKFAGEPGALAESLDRVSDGGNQIQPRWNWRESHGENWPASFGGRSPQRLQLRLEQRYAHSLRPGRSHQDRMGPDSLA